MLVPQLASNIRLVNSTIIEGDRVVVVGDSSDINNVTILSLKLNLLPGMQPSCSVEVKHKVEDGRVPDHFVIRHVPQKI